MILKKFALTTQWPTQEPFLFCAHHLDLYPKGTPGFGPGPDLLLERDIGQDFHGKDGFNMYHGEVIPGFPVHPHRGFETVTVVRRGYVDHSDSKGAAGRYAAGDVQWMTAGKGVQHSEMFPLLNQGGDNTLELFQIWLNLPKANKMTEPDFKMFWSENIPEVAFDAEHAKVRLVAGSLADKTAIAPPAASWAANPKHETQIWLIEIEENGQITLPEASSSAKRSLYFYEGEQLQLNEETVTGNMGMFVSPHLPLKLRALKKRASLLMLQSQPIGEPVVQYGPFVMNTEAEIRQTISEYQSTRFGGWPWEAEEMVHGLDPARFAKYPDGTMDRPQQSLQK